jgi:hypothetical protein
MLWTPDPHELQGRLRHPHRSRVTVGTSSIGRCLCDECHCDALMSAGLNRDAYGSTVFINITLYADHSDRLKYSSLPVDQGCRNGA